MSRGRGNLRSDSSGLKADDILLPRVCGAGGANLPSASVGGSQNTLSDGDDRTASQGKGSCGSRGIYRAVCCQKGGRRRKIPGRLCLPLAARRDVFGGKKTLSRSAYTAMKQDKEARGLKNFAVSAVWRRRCRKVLEEKGYRVLCWCCNAGSKIAKASLSSVGRQTARKQWSRECGHSEGGCIAVPGF